MILLLDDDVAFRDELAVCLRDAGYPVLACGSAEDLDSAASAARSTCLITDYRVGGSDGLEMADRFHAAHPDVPVVMITSDRDAALSADAHRRDFLYFFCKPLTAGALARVVATLAPQDALRAA